MLFCKIFTKKDFRIIVDAKILVTFHQPRNFWVISSFKNCCSTLTSVHRHCYQQQQQQQQQDDRKNGYKVKTNLFTERQSIPKHQQPSIHCRNRQYLPGSNSTNFPETLRNNYTLHPEFKCIDINPEYRDTGAEDLGKQLRPFIDSFFRNDDNITYISSKNESTLSNEIIFNTGNTITNNDFNSITKETNINENNIASEGNPRTKNLCNKCVTNENCVNCQSTSDKNSIHKDEISYSNKTSFFTTTTNNNSCSANMNNQSNQVNKSNTSTNITNTDNNNNNNNNNNNSNGIDFTTTVNALLIKNLPITSAGDFHDFLAGCGYEKMVYTNGSGFREPLNEFVYTASDEPAAFTIEPHNEMSYLDTFPSKVCISFKLINDIFLWGENNPYSAPIKTYFVLNDC